jgi:exodeoxyribonuclease V alpha subunit
VGMRGGLERWKRGLDSGGVRSAISYALNGGCDAASRLPTGAAALATYGNSGAVTVTRFTVTDGATRADELDRDQLAAWVDGLDPHTGERRGRDLSAPNADLVLDGTINAPKSYSLVALLHLELAKEFEALQDRLRDRIITTWQRELNARRGAGGRIRERLHQVEVVELQHRRSRALDPHIHRHLWLSVKVLGADGVWSNVDSRVAMKLHTLVNAEGDLAARTDSEWIDALARHGYTLNADGEVAEVAHAVRALSRRSNQIEANRAVLLAEWRAAHPGQEPSRDILQQLDRRAWAQGRPGKPKDLREDRWELMIRDELATIDPSLLAARAPIMLEATPVGDLDIELLAARAVVDADARSSAYGGRFSMFDIRAGATRAVAAAGVVAPREELQVVIDAAVNRALGHTVDLLDEDPERPQHVKGYMAQMTAALKVELARRFEMLSAPGAPLSVDAMTLVAESELPPGAVLDPGQGRAAGAISGTDRLVTVTGPAGTGKTTMLRVAHAALSLQQRRMIVVAPTKKAATVAGQEIGAVASSVHALLADHGWRWGRDATGAAEWSRLAPGDTDPTTGLPYAGPTRYLVSADDRIVIDEAGMLDLHTANALAALAIETGAGLAMVGDHLQAMPVGHSGAMATMARRSGSVVELTAVHRFHDPTYAALTLRLREPETREAALEVAAELDRRGLVHRVDDLGGATEIMVEGYFRWSGDRKRVALVTSTNEEADLVNESIQQRRLELGQLNMQRVAVGRGEQRLLEGDVVQTRRNDRKADVENRALWTIRRIRPDSVDLESLTDSADFRRVSTDYVAEHVHLAYASTVHGIQGETTDASIVGPGVDASGLYVGMTRGRIRNEAIAISRTQGSAVAAIADSMTRGAPEVTLDDSRRAATIELQRAARPQPDLSSSPIPSQATWINAGTPGR